MSKYETICTLNRLVEELKTRITTPSSELADRLLNSNTIVITSPGTGNLVLDPQSPKTRKFIREIVDEEQEYIDGMKRKISGLLTQL